MLQMHKWQLLPPKRVKGMYDSFTNLPQIKSFSSLNLYENRTLGPPPPLPPRSTRPDYVSVERSVDSDTKAPLVVVEVSDSESDGLKDLEKSLTVVEISDTESDDLVEPSKNVSANVQAIDSDAKSAAVTNAGMPSLRSMPPPQRGYRIARNCQQVLVTEFHQSTSPFSMRLTFIFWTNT